MKREMEVAEVEEEDAMDTVSWRTNSRVVTPSGQLLLEKHNDPTTCMYDK